MEKKINFSVFFLLIICSFEKAGSDTETISQSDFETQAIKVFNDFSSCSLNRKQTETNFLSCTGKFLYPDLSENIKERISSFLLLDNEMTGPHPCNENSLERAKLHPKYTGYVLCFEIKTPNDFEKSILGFIFYKLSEAKKPLIFSIKY